MPGMPAGSELAVYSTEHQSPCQSRPTVPTRRVRSVRGTTDGLMIGISLFSGRTLVSHFDFGIDNKSMFLIQSLTVLSLDYYVGANAPDRVPPAWIFS